jgi:acyl carrier protein
MNIQAADQQLEQSIRKFIASDILYSQEGFPYADDASLLQEGVIDSLGVVELVTFVQKQYHVKVEQQEVVPDNFDSVAKLSAFVRRKLNEGKTSQ